MGWRDESKPLIDETPEDAGARKSGDWRYVPHQVFTGHLERGGWVGDEGSLLRFMANATDYSKPLPPPPDPSLFDNALNGARSLLGMPEKEPEPVDHKQIFIDEFMDRYGDYKSKQDEELVEAMRNAGWSQSRIRDEMKYMGREEYPGHLKNNQWGKMLKKAGLFDEVMNELGR